MDAAGPEGELAALRARVAELEAAARDAERVEEDLRASKEMLQLVMDTIPQHVFWKDLDSVYAGCNRNFAAVAGVETVDDIVGKTDFDLAWERSEAEFFRECDRRVMDDDAPEFHIIEPQLQADGKRAWLDTNKVPLHDAQGNVVGILGTFEDITSRKEAEDALAASEENLRITLQSIGDAVIATDASGRITRINPVAEALTGWTEAESVGLPLADVFHIVNGETRRPVESPVEKVLAEGQVVGLANGTVLIARDGGERQIADSGAPIRDKAGEIVGVVLVFRDVTREYEVEAQLRHSQKMDSIGQLAGGVAHDFNNALTGILGAAELLSVQLASGHAAQETVGLIADAASRAAELTEKLLAFSRKGAVERTPLDAHRSIAAAVDLLRRSIDKRIELVTRLEAQRTVVRGDETQLQHAILNLGINARDALTDGGRIEISTSNLVVDADAGPSEALAPGEYLEICVRDDGPGIPSEVQSRIFEPFFTTKGVGKGTGLGLAAVYGAVTRHEGVVRVASEVGQGTQFRLYLPLDTATVAPPRTEQPEPTAGCVLVVDDEPLVRLVAAGLLEKLGCRVHVAGSGDEALALYRDRGGEIDLVLLDVVMPGRSGRDTFLALRELDPQAQVVFCSGFGRDSRIDALLEVGALGFLKKPFTSAQLSEAVRPHLPG